MHINSDSSTEFEEEYDLEYQNFKIIQIVNNDLSNW